MSRAGGLLLVLCVVVGCGADDQTQPGRRNGKIAFTYMPTGVLHKEAAVVVVETDGAEEHALVARSRAQHANPSWSPDGSRIAVERYYLGGDREDFGLAVMNADGTAVQTLVAGSVEAPEWSPDGKQIAFAKSKTYRVRVGDRMEFGGFGAFPASTYIRLADGRLRRLTRGGWDEGPTWSPDGMRIAFQRGSSYGDLSTAIYAVNADGTGLKLLGPGAEPDWSPSGKQILFTVWDEFWTEADIYVMNADGSDRSLLVEGGMSASWTPDGEKIVFMSLRDGEEIWTMDADGSNHQRVPAQIAAGCDSCTAQPNWQPLPPD